MRFRLHIMIALIAFLLSILGRQEVHAQGLRDKPWTILPTSPEPFATDYLLSINSYWQPSTELVEKIEGKLFNIRPPSDEHPDKVSIRLYDMSRRLFRYYRQYIGVEKGGKKYIYIEGFHRRLLQENKSVKQSWRTSLQGGFDGCDTWWHLVYDVKADRFLKLTVNGPCQEFSPFDEEKQCSQDAVSDFATAPNETNFNRLTGLGVSSTFYVKYDCLEQVGKIKEGWSRIIKTASDGNTWAVKFIVANLNQLDGGELHDALIALGVSMDKKPTVLLTLYRDGEIDPDTLKLCVSQTPLELVDDQHGSLSFLKLRREKISSLKITELEHAKQDSLFYLDETIRGIETKTIGK